MHVGNALSLVSKGALTSHSQALRFILQLLILQMLNAVTAITVAGGSTRLHNKEPSQTLLDHTQTHFLPNRTGIVQLFEWKFTDIARECEEFLGPHGFAGVQVSPVTEHLVVQSAGIENPWWERYQPLSYKIDSRSGNEVEFAHMSRACNVAGVRVYVDVVLNHLAGAYDEETASGQRLLEGYAGSTANASSFDFPAFPFTHNHFHKPCELNNFMDARVVRNCALNGWPDLDHYCLDVRGNLTDLLNRLVDLGVAGFRVDSAKYICPIDIKLIFNDVKNLNSDEFDFPENARPFVYQSVVDLGVDSISKTEYSSYGMVTDYLYAAELANIINGKAPLSSLINWGPAMGFLPHQQALVFVDSHDAQRDSKLLGANRLLSYKQPRKHIMATAFMLAHPYGRVKRIMSSYYFAAQQPEQGPPMEEGADEAEAEPKDDAEVVPNADVVPDVDVVSDADAGGAKEDSKEDETEVVPDAGAEEIGEEAKETEADEAEAEENEPDEAQEKEPEGEEVEAEKPEGEEVEGEDTEAEKPEEGDTKAEEPKAEEAEGGEGDDAANEEPPVANAPSSHIRSPTFDASTGRCQHESGWVCEHRWPQIVNMIELVRTLDEMEDGVMNFQTDSPNHISFCRGAKAFFAFNNDAEMAYDAEVVTCLPSGVYCDVISGGRAANAESATYCLGKRIVVDTDGKTQITLPAVLGEAGAVAGSDYDEADVEGNDAYGNALGAEGEFGVLAVYDGSRLDVEVELVDKKPEGNAAEVPADDDAKEITTEAAKEDDAEEMADKTEASPEELEGSSKETEKVAKLEEAVHDASVEGSDADVGTVDGGEEEPIEENEEAAPGKDGVEEVGGGEKDDSNAEKAVADAPAAAYDASVGESGILEENLDKQEEIEQGVTDTSKNVEDETLVPPLGSMGIGIKSIAQGIANNTNKVIAKAAFNDAPRMSQRYELPSAKSSLTINPR